MNGDVVSVRFPTSFVLMADPVLQDFPDAACLKKGFYLGGKHRIGGHLASFLTFVGLFYTWIENLTSRTEN